MGALTKYYKKEIHYKDFLAFGEDRFIRCKNVLPELSNMSSGNLSTHAYEGYKMIIKAQLEESRKNDNKMRLKTSIRDWEEMEPLVLKQKCHEIAEKFQQEAHGLLLEMKQKKPHKQFDSW